MATEYPSDWNTRRKDVYQRDGYQCQNCGKEGGSRGETELHAHHIVPKSKGGTHQRSNLITVCKDCHNAIHGDNTAPTAPGRNYNQNQLAAKVVDTISNIAESDEASNNAVDRLYQLFSSEANDSGFLIDEYKSIRYEIIKQAFKTKENIEEYQANVRPYLNKEAQTDLDTYVDATWDSVKSKVFVTGHADDILMEFSQREIKCTECGEIVDPESQFCKHCGDEVELVPECDNCGNELDTDSNFCSQCGTEVENEIEPDQQLPVDERAVDDHADEMLDEIDKVVDKTTLVQVLEGKFELVWLDDFTPVWAYCPNCGLERGVLSKQRSAECVLCDAEWVKKGILNTYWEAVSIPNIDSVDMTDQSNIDWKSIGVEKNNNDTYISYIGDIAEQQA